MTEGPGHIVLIGLMGSGKTTVGHGLAGALERPLRDSDADLLARTGRSARDIAAGDGIAALHELELTHLLESLASPEPAVIAAAAAVIDAPEGRAALAAPSVRVAWLRIDPDTAVRRGRGGTHRPDHDLVAQAARRDPWFAAVADVAVDVTADDALSVVARLHGWASTIESTR